MGVGVGKNGVGGEQRGSWLTGGGYREAHSRQSLKTRHI